VNCPSFNRSIDPYFQFTTPMQNSTSLQCWTIAWSVGVCGWWFGLAKNDDCGRALSLSGHFSIFLQFICTGTRLRRTNMEVKWSFEDESQKKFFRNERRWSILVQTNQCSLFVEWALIFGRVLRGCTGKGVGWGWGC
jgi:hypothetical protein